MTLSGVARRRRQLISLELKWADSRMPRPSRLEPPGAETIA
jgi:hypothetical protein